MNVAEDLSGLSRAELVYKAKLAEQAERCVRAASRFHFGFSTVARPVAGGEQKRPSGAPGSGRSRIGSGFGGTERATAVARDDPRGVREPVSGGASDRAARAPRRPGSRARSRGFFARRAHRQLEPRHQLERGARARTRGATAWLARAATSRLRRAATSRCVQPRRASASPGAPSTPRGGRPLGPARLGTAGAPVNAHTANAVWCREARFLFFVFCFLLVVVGGDERTART